MNKELIGILTNNKFEFIEADISDILSANILRQVSNSTNFVLGISGHEWSHKTIRNAHGKLNTLLEMAVGASCGFGLLRGQVPPELEGRFSVDEVGICYGDIKTGVWIFSETFLRSSSSSNLFGKWQRWMGLESENIPVGVWQKVCFESNIAQLELEKRIVNKELKLFNLKASRSFRIGNEIIRAFKKKNIFDIIKLPMSLIREARRFHGAGLRIDELSNLAERYISEGYLSEIEETLVKRMSSPKNHIPNLFEFRSDLINLGLGKLVLDGLKNSAFSENTVQSWSNLIVTLRANKSILDLHRALECIGRSAPKATRDHDHKLIQKWRRNPILASQTFDGKKLDRSTRIDAVANKIVYVLHNSLPYSSGGYAIRSHECAKALKGEGFDVICVTRPGFPCDLNVGIKSAEMPKKDVIDGIPYFRILNPSRKGLDLVDYLEESSNELKSFFELERPMCVLAASNHVNAMAAMFAAKSLGIPFFYEIRGLWEVTRSSRQPAFKSSEAYMNSVMYESLVADRADKVFPITRGIKKEMVRRGVDEQKMVLWPNSMRVNTETSSTEPTFSTRLIDQWKKDGCVIIGYVGTFVDYEGLEQLVEVFCSLRKKNQHLRLLMVGSDNASANSKGPISEKLKKIVNDQHEADSVEFLGRVDPASLNAVYTNLDVFVIPRLPLEVCEIVSPIKPLEAMAHRVPLIVSSVDALTEIVEHGKTGLVFDKSDKTDLAKQLSILVNDSDLRSRLAASAYSWAMNHRIWSQTVKPIASEITKTCRDNCVGEY